MKANFVNVYELIKEVLDNIEDQIDEVFKDCKYKCFNSVDKWCRICKIKFVNGRIIRDRVFVVSSDDGSIKCRSGKIFRNALGDINKLTVNIFATVSDFNPCYYLKTSLPSSFERRFFKNISNNEEYINIFCYDKPKKFGNDCIRLFFYGISKDVSEYINLCYVYEADGEL